MVRPAVMVFNDSWVTYFYNNQLLVLDVRRIDQRRLAYTNYGIDTAGYRPRTFFYPGAAVISGVGWMLGE